MSSSLSTSPQEALPTFIVIGAMKSGTTSLYYYLRDHPEIEMATQHEADYFVAEKNWDRGEAWYRSLFVGDESVRGDVSPNYSKAHCFPGVPRRMHYLVPDVKLLYLVRDPIVRIRSHYVHNFTVRAETRSLYEAVTSPQPKDNHYVRCSAYHWQIRQYRQYFDDEQILILGSEALRSKPVKTLRHIYQFLGVDSERAEHQEEQKRHQSEEKQRIPLLEHKVDNRFLRAALRPFLPASYTQPQDFEIPEVGDKTRTVLVDVLHDDVEALREYTGKSFEGWRDCFANQ